MSDVQLHIMDQCAYFYLLTFLSLPPFLADFTKKYNAVKAGQPPSNPNEPSVKRFDPSSKVLKKFENKINLGTYEAPVLSTSSVNSLEGLCRKTELIRIRAKDKSDRATTEQVLDPRTRMILFKLLSRGYVSEINGCVSTGKEANVYHATSSEGDCAIKVYKTSILVFKDRDKYVTGEFRFRHGYSRHNPRKMVCLWAEKEMRNLSRLYQHGIPCPQPIILRSHVLVMKFLGNNGWPYPKLKDIDISESKAREIYLECVLIMRRLYHHCKLVHADLSEYNILYGNSTPYIIDVSQSVEHDHPQALEFLRKDCTNITEFFRKKYVHVMTVKELFEFITDPTITEDNLEEYLEHAQKKATSRDFLSKSVEDEVSEAVFQKIFIPRSLTEVASFEQDVNQIQSGQTLDVAYQTVTGLRPDLSGAQTVPQLLLDIPMTTPKEDTTPPLSGSDENSDNLSNIENSDDDDDDNLSEATPSKDDNQRRERAELRKAHKQAVKEEKREKRKTKVPKHVKKRKEKVARQRFSKK